MNYLRLILIVFYLKKELMISTGPYDQVVGKLARESAQLPSFSMA